MSAKQAKPLKANGKKKRLVPHILHGYKRIPIEQIKTRDRNPRMHSPHQIEQLRAAIREFGFTNPVLVDEKGELIAGHGRLAAAKLEGLADLPAIELKGLTLSQKRALVIADNQLALTSEWDAAMLLDELKALEGDLVKLAGFDDAEVSRLIAIVDNLATTDPGAEWNGMPEFDQQDKTAFRSIVIHFHDQQGVLDFAAKTGLVVTEKTRYLWFPEIRIDRLADKRYVSEGAPA
jgi:hypothetical protein